MNSDKPEEDNQYLDLNQYLEERIEADNKQREFYDVIDNMSLIENGLQHIKFELSREKPSFFRIARESHALVYRSMIEALRGPANLEVTGKTSKEGEHAYKLGNDPWKKIKRIKVEGCDKAWRFSTPEVCEQPETNDTTPEDILNRPGGDFLIHFYDALARIQSDNFMEKLVHSKAIPISDEDMRLFEWLHEEIRNKYEHFIPSTRLSPKRDLCFASKRCLKLSLNLLFDSGNVIFHEENQEELKSLFTEVLKKLECSQKTE